MATASNTPASRTKTAAAKRTTAARRPASGTSRTKGVRSRTTAAPASAPRRTTAIVGDYAERAILIPVGAALIARERVVSTVSDTVSTYSSSTKAQKEIQAQLRRFERRGSTARNRLEREVRKTRTRLERELRQRRRELEARRSSLTKNLTKQVEQTQTQIEDAVRTRLEEGADLAERIQERVQSLV
jgi:hypothetical protein